MDRKPELVFTDHGGWISGPGYDRPPWTEPLGAGELALLLGKLRHAMNYNLHRLPTFDEAALRGHALVIQDLLDLKGDVEQARFQIFMRGN